ncbi:MAG: hypothetical protein QOJ84_2377 [Bradyrhizobium sp.]|nr:hypothetical protein [Bradyrhizobium sp.]
MPTMNFNDGRNAIPRTPRVPLRCCMIPCSINPRQDASVDSGLVRPTSGERRGTAAVLEQVYSVTSGTDN